MTVIRWLILRYRSTWATCPRRSQSRVCATTCQDLVRLIKSRLFEVSAQFLMITIQVADWLIRHSDKNIGFVHFLSISTAIKVVQNLPLEQDWLGRRISYGKDRCAYVPKNQHQQQQHNLAAAARGNLAANYAGYGLLAPTMMIPNGFEARELDCTCGCTWFSIADEMKFDSYRGKRRK